MTKPIEARLELESNENEIIKAKNANSARIRVYGPYASKVALTCGCGHQEVYGRVSFVNYLKKEGWGNPNNPGVKLEDFRKDYRCKNCDPNGKKISFN